MYANGLDTHCLLWRRGSLQCDPSPQLPSVCLGKWHKVQIPIFSSARGYGTVLLIAHAKNTNRRQRHYYLQDLAPKVHHRILFSNKLAEFRAVKGDSSFSRFDSEILSWKRGLLSYNADFQVQHFVLLKSWENRGNKSLEWCPTRDLDIKTWDSSASACFCFVKELITRFTWESFKARNE